MAINKIKSALLLTLLVFSFAQAKKVNVMSYNVENLFDTVHDEGKLDYTYLPKSFKDSSEEVQKYCESVRVPYWRDECYNIDWLPSKLLKKLDSLTRVLKATNRGEGPDVLSLQEVENKRVLDLWYETHLKDMGYREPILIEGPDKRGIDVAFFSKYPLAEPAKFHDVNEKLSWDDLTSFSLAIQSLVEPQAKMRDERGFLEATFDFGRGKEVTFLGNHWPSQGNPDTERYEIAKVHYDVVKEVAQKGRAVVSLGDFNTLDSDDPHGLNEWLMNKRRKHHFHDAREEYLAEVGGSIEGLPGSHWYRGHYSALDKILILEDFADQIDPDWISFKTTAEHFMMWPTDKGPYKFRPMRFSFTSASGFSDHLPVSIDLNL